MNKADLSILDATLSNAIRLERFTAGERKKVLAILDDLQKELRVKLMGDLTDFGKARVNKLLSESTAIIEAAYKEMSPVNTWWKGAPADVLPAGLSSESMIIKALPTLSAEQTMWLDLSLHEVSNKAVTSALRQSWKEQLEADTLLKMPILKSLREGATLSGAEKKAFLATLERDQAIHAKYLSGELRISSATGGKSWHQAWIDAYDNIIAEVSRKGEGIDLLGLARHEATATARIFATIGLEAAIPTEAVLRALVSDTLLQGAPLKAWWAKQSETVAFNFANQVRQGIVQGETLQQIIIRVAGSKRLGTPGIMDIARRHASTLVHDSIMTVANSARMAVYKENDDIMKGYRHLSTLDSLTSKICIAYSGATWDLDFSPTGGTTLPFGGGTPRHPNCRSLTLPILKSYKELGADIEEPPTGTRASDLGQIPADTSFDAFLKRHDKAYQDDLLGPGRADLWRDGKITLSDLIGQNNRPLTLDQLKKK